MAEADEEQIRELSLAKIWEGAEITGAPQIARSRGWRRVYKVVMLVLCLVGMGYQTSEFVLLYLSHPMILIAKMEYPESILAPAFSVCTGNSLNRQKYCRDFPEHCDENNTLLPDFWNIEDTATRDMYKKYPIKWQEVGFYTDIGWSSETFPIPDEVITFPVIDDRGKPVLCFAANHQLLGPNASRPRFPTTFNSILATYENDIKLSFFSDPRLNIRDLRRRPKFAFHSPFKLVNPYQEGEDLHLARFDTAQIRVTETYRLPAPYSTDCEDYVGKWNNRTNPPLSRDMCIQQCIQDKTIKICKCIPVGILSFSEDKICQKDDMACVREVEVEDCYTVCKMDCYSIDYHFIVSPRDIENTNGNLLLRHANGVQRCSGLLLHAQV